MEEFRDLLNTVRKDLISLSNRNPLLNYRVKKASGLKIVNERSKDIYDILVNRRKVMFFSHQDNAKQVSFDDDLLEYKIIDNADESHEKYTDNILQTPYCDKDLFKRLFRTHNNAKTYLEERGVNTLFLALGMLEWHEDSNSEIEHSAPLLLIPVTLKRSKVFDKFSLECLDENIIHNVSLHEKLFTEFGIELPIVDPDDESFDIKSYFDRIRHLISGKKVWGVFDDQIILDCFSFNKYFMYLDLDPNNWDENAPGFEVVDTLIAQRDFEQSEKLFDDDVFLDDVIEVDELFNVMDIDSTQTLAVLDALHSDNLIIQGPPGTGKSQTIVNIIAQAIGQSKKVLFVSEKMAALDVVKRRLDSVGLGDACLELHSQKAGKKIILDELRRVMNQGKPKVDLNKTKSLFYDINKHRRELNQYCEAVNKKVKNCGYTPHDLYGATLRIKALFEMQNCDIPNVRLPKDALEWTQREEKNLQEKINNLQIHINTIGLPCEHLFYGVGKSFFSSSDIRLVNDLLSKSLLCFKDLEIIIAHIEEFTAISPCVDMSTMSHTVELLENLRNYVSVQTCDYINAFWEAADGIIELLIELDNESNIYNEHKSRYSAILIDGAWNQDVMKHRTVISAKQKSPFAYMSTPFRDAKSFCIGLQREHIKFSRYDCLNVYDAIISCREIDEHFSESNELLTSLFGSAWEREKSDFKKLIELSKWIKKVHEISQEQEAIALFDYAKKGNDKLIIDELIKKIKAITTEISSLTKRLFEIMEFNPSEDWENKTFAAQEKTFNDWSEGIGSINEIPEYNEIKEELTVSRLDDFEILARDWVHAPRLLAATFEYLWLELLLDYSEQDSPVLRKFHREQHESIRKTFQEKDSELLEINRLRLLKRHDDGLPYGLPDLGEMKVLKYEMAKKRRHMSLRNLLEKTGQAIQTIKPVFMMSPLSIAAYLGNKNITFDLVIFDEASQMKPVDAFGAIIRSKKVVVVGDSKQLPPTTFFDRDDVSDNEIEDEDFNPSDVESILDLFEAKNVRSRMLLWHYRSKNPSLIKVSNKEFYDNRLWVIPPTESEQNNRSVLLNYNPGDIYDKGKSRTNREEAKRVAKYVMDFAQKHPELTLGVVAFSSAQVQAISFALETLRRQEPFAEEFFNESGPEPFFIKALENVQGDERDVIFISVGYGKTDNGKTSQNFGPINKIGGERRLNVLFTRAKVMITVFSSITDEDIRVAENTPRGVKVLKTYLHYARTGLIDTIETPTGGFDSPFEHEVYNAINKLGYEADSQVGQSGFFIDIAVIHPQHPGKYVLGVECDGATYHSSRSSRDRDRLRQILLEDKGWQIHHIWSTDWFSNQKREIERLHKVIEKEVMSGQTKKKTIGKTPNTELNDVHETPIIN